MQQFFFLLTIFFFGVVLVWCGNKFNLIEFKDYILYTNNQLNYYSVNIEAII